MSTHRPDCPANYDFTAPCTKGCTNPRDVSTPEQPGTAIFHTERTRIDVEPGSCLPGPTRVIVTRADRWILVNREFMARLRDEGAVDHGPLFFAAGYPDSVKYRFVRKFDEHSDVYERIDEPAAPTPDDGVIDLDPEVAELLASNERPAQPVADEALREITQQAIRSAARVDELNEELTKAGQRNRLLTEVLNEVLGSFTQQGHPGEPCLRTGWIGTRTVARWRRIAAGKPSYDEMIERLAGVELTDWQREHLRQVWEYREMHGRWPAQIHLSSAAGRRNGVATEREALRQLIQLAEQAGA